MSGQKAYASPGQMGRVIEVRITDQREKGITYIASPLVMEQADDNAYYFPPTFTLRREDAQALVDDLHNMGFRPSAVGSPSDAHKAMSDHLADLRKILFKKLNISE